MDGIIGVARNAARLLCFSSSSSRTMFVLKILISCNIRNASDGDADALLKRWRSSCIKKLGPWRVRRLVKSNILTSDGPIWLEDNNCCNDERRIGFWHIPEIDLFEEKTTSHLGIASDDLAIIIIADCLLPGCLVPYGVWWNDKRVEYNHAPSLWCADGREALSVTTRTGFTHPQNPKRRTTQSSRKNYVPYLEAGR